MSDQQIEKKTSLDSVVWNDLESPERSSSDRFYSPYDVAILQRLQFLTQRVQYLENKLENSLSDKREDLSFGLSVDHKDNVPNLDIKVLSGHNDEDENVMAGWDDAIVERNTSFLIIPVGEDKDLQTNDPEMIKQTLDLSIKPSVGSRPALCCSDSYREVIDTNSFKESTPAEEQSTKTNSISVRIRPPPVKTYVQSTNQSSPSNSNHYRSEKPKEFEIERVFPKNVEMQHAVSSREDQETHNMTNKMSKLTTSPQRDNNNNDLKYGYTISLSRSPNKDNHKEKYHSFNYNLPPVDSRKNGQDDIGIDFGNTLEKQKTHTENSSYTNCNDAGQAESQGSPQQNVCFQDVEICEVVKYEDNYNTFDRTVDLKIERRISNENVVYSQTNRRESFSKQSKNANNSFVYEAEVNTVKENQVVRNGESFNSGVHDSLCSHDKLFPVSNGGVARRKMQIPDSRAKRMDHCRGIDSDESLILEDNEMPWKGLPQNNSYLNTNHFNNADCCEYSDTTIQPDQKHHTANKPVIKKVRVRSVEVPYTSSDDDAFSVSSASELSVQNSNRYQRPQRRKPKSKAPKSHNIEKQLKELINPNEIVNAREHIEASRRPLHLAAMSPTESGYVGSSPSSPRDELKDSSFTSVSNPLRPDSPCSSVTSTTTPIQVERSLPSTRILHHSVASSTSSEYSHSKGIHDGDTLPSLGIGNTRLNDVLPGPTRLSLSDDSPTQLRLSEFLLASEELSVASTASSVVTSDLSDSFLDCQDEFCQCQTGISTEDDFREELKSISRYVIEAGEKSGGKKKRGSLKKYFLDEEQGEMDIFGAKLQKGEHRAVPLLVKVILRMRKHFFGGFEGPYSLKSLTPIQNKQFFPEKTSPREKKITFSPSAMLLSAVGESSASEIRDVIEKESLDVNELSPSGKSLLHKAAASGNLETIHTLIQYGADVNLPDQDGFAPVHAALRKCHYKCAIFLIECGTDMSSYTRTRIQELAEINTMARAYKKTVLNTAL